MRHGFVPPRDLTIIRTRGPASSYARGRPARSNPPPWPQSACVLRRASRCALRSPTLPRGTLAKPSMAGWLPSVCGPCTSRRRAFRMQTRRTHPTERSQLPTGCRSSRAPTSRALKRRALARRARSVRGATGIRRRLSRRHRSRCCPRRSSGCWRTVARWRQVLRRRGAAAGRCGSRGTERGGRQGQGAPRRSHVEVKVLASPSAGYQVEPLQTRQGMGPRSDKNNAWSMQTSDTSHRKTAAELCMLH
eukprot:6202687-Pleurochrysis_carterae.AAC.6